LVSEVTSLPSIGEVIEIKFLNSTAVGEIWIQVQVGMVSQWSIYCRAAAGEITLTVPVANTDYWRRLK
jgi:hypothetical protein